MNATSHRLSRSIISNRFSQFATLYDPDAFEDTESDPGDAPGSSIPENPTVQIDPDGRRVSVPLRMGGAAYRQYRLSRLAKDPTCYYCGCRIDENSSSLDHIVPESRGGDNWPANLRLACRACNSTKSDRTPVEWLGDLEAEIARIQKLAARLAEVIEADGLDYYAPTCERPYSTGSPVPKAIDPESITTLPPIVQGEPGEAETVENVKEWHPKEFEPGRRTYWIVEKGTRKPILKHLGINAAAHYLENVGGEGVELMCLIPFYRKSLGLIKPPKDEHHQRLLAALEVLEADA